MPILNRGLITILAFCPRNSFRVPLFRVLRTTINSFTSDLNRVSKHRSNMVFSPQGSDNLSTPILLDSPAPRRMAEILDIFPFRRHFDRQASPAAHPHFTSSPKGPIKFNRSSQFLSRLSLGMSALGPWYSKNR